MSAARLVDLTDDVSVDPVEVIGLRAWTEYEGTTILTYAGPLRCELPIADVRRKLRG